MTEPVEIMLLGGKTLSTWSGDDACVHALMLGHGGEFAHATFTGKDAELTAMLVMVKWATWNANEYQAAPPPMSH
jgi:hypothetical protein